MQKTWMAKPEDIDERDRNWYLADVSGLPLGRVASEIATVLQGKHKPAYTPHVDVGDYVVVTNASEIELTGNKREQKIHYNHSGYLGNLKQMNYDELLQKEPELAVKKAVRRMMPKNKLGQRMLKKLKIYRDEKHPHSSVDFQELDI